MNVAVDCPECCTPPGLSFMVQARSATRTKYGYSPDGFFGFPDPCYPKLIYSRLEQVWLVGSPDPTCYADMVEPGLFNTFHVWTWEETDPITGEETNSGEIAGFGPPPPGWYIRYTFFGLYENETLFDNVLADLEDEDFTEPALDAPAASRLLSEDERTAGVEECKYDARHPIPKVGNGKCYRAEWVERFVPKVVYNEAHTAAVSGGASVDSVEILGRGVYRPEVTLAPPPSGGTQAYAVAVMAADGTVASIRVLNPGSGYTEAPEVSLTGDATATAIIDDEEASPNYGRVTGIEVDEAGDYLPELVFSDPPSGGTLAEATVTLDPQGGIATVEVTEPGEFYAAVGLSIEAASELHPAILFIHYGTETARCYKWDGVTPEGYDEGDAATWPHGTELELLVPDEEGETSCEVKRIVTDCTDCPA